MFTPEIVTGARGPRELVAPKEIRGPVGIPEGKRVFRAKATRYRLQLSAPEDLRLGDGRIVKGPKPLVAQFGEGFLILDLKKDADRIGLITQHVDYKGNGGLDDVWDFADEIAEARENRLSTAVQTALQATPEERAAILEALAAGDAEDFKLPPGKRPANLQPPAEKQ